MEAGFAKASSNNLPGVDALMIGDFLSNNADYVGCEQRGVKLSRSSRESYGDSAIGYVQLKRDGGKCCVHAKVTPEHKVRMKPYSVMVTVNENEEMIEDARCQSCTAAKGGCKHAIALLMWLHRRSEEPSPTEVESYWKKSKLSALGSGLKPMKVRDMTGAIPLRHVEEGSFRKEVMSALEQCGEYGSGLMSMNFHLNVKNLAIHQMLITYRGIAAEESHSGEASTALNFLNYAAEYMKQQNLCQIAFESTLSQHVSPVWHQLRLGRISASRAYDVMHCKKRDGVLVDMIVGARKIKDNSAMKRGRELEGIVIKELERELGHKIERCGLALDPEHPFLGATPDGMFGETVVEVKCPQKHKTVANYLKEGNPTPKYYTQMMVQMLILRKQRGLFAVADPEFESNKKFSKCLIHFDEGMANVIVKECEKFWCDTIFPRLN